MLLDDVAILVLMYKIYKIVSPEFNRNIKQINFEKRWLC